MANTPPDPQSSRTSNLGFDEFVGILVAFAAIGTVLLWALARKNSGSTFIEPLLLQSPTPFVTPPIVIPPTPEATTPIPTVKPTQSQQPREIEPAFNIAPQELSQLRSSDVPPAQIVEEQYRFIAPADKKSIMPPPIVFADVPANFWGRRFIDVLSSRYILKGFPDNSFKPNQPVTRAEFAVMLKQAFRIDITQNKEVFKDLPPDFWATPAINQTLNAGFLKGYPNKTFQPQQNIPRVQVLVALVSGLNLPVPAAPAKYLSIYKDAEDIPNYATNKVAIATLNELVVNHPDTQVLEPNKTATRAEVAAMIHQALVLTGRLEAIQSQNIVQVSQ